MFISFIRPIFIHKNEVLKHSARVTVCNALHRHVIFSPWEPDWPATIT